MAFSVIVIEGFERWMVAMGYAESTIQGSVNYVRDFYLWLKVSSVTEINQIDTRVVRAYYGHLQKRKRKRGSGSLSDNYINSNINALKRFSRYLQESGKGNLEIDVQRRSITTKPRIVLSQEEIHAMYRACGKTSEVHSKLLGIRDRAILGVYYGCGLRRSEGISLNISDVQLKEKMIQVRKGKNYRERYVPMTERVADDLAEYIMVAREHILGFKQIRHEALFLSMQVKRLCGNQVIERVKMLARKAGIDKEVGLHILRHSIATHLLQSGLSLEEVSQFLGHSSLESTQIYTHIAHESQS